MLAAPGVVLIVAAKVRPHALFPPPILWICVGLTGAAIVYTLTLGFTFGRQLLWMYVLFAAA
ncbi:hypothetical protein ACIRRA_44730, partial [Nocardia sp. NPDC101769]|uniref:hypothetical protein n=1 Tax=Nocardia sp. NPDC101769 TaxID=3364333 RepID=UPI00380B60A9